MRTRSSIQHQVHEDTCDHPHTSGGRWIDRIGVVSTMVCAVHCMLTPVYTIAKVLDMPAWVEWADWIILPLSILGVLHLSRHYNRGAWKAIVWSGWAMMAAGTILEHILPIAFILALAGATMLLVAYIRHLRYSR